MKKIFASLTALLLALSMIVVALASTGASLSIKLKYDTPDEGRLDVKTILTGGIANISVSPVGAFTPYTPPLIVADKGGLTNPDFTQLQINDWGTGHRLTVPPSFGAFMPTEEATMSLQGNYTALLSAGKVYEMPAGTIGAPSLQNDMTISGGQVPVTGANNRITIRCETAESGSVQPSFKIDGTLERSGVFAGYDEVYTVSCDQDYRLTDNENTVLNPKFLTINMKNSSEPNGGSLATKDFRLEVKQTYLERETTPDPVTGEPKVKAKHNYIQAGTTFTLNLVGPTSNELLLNVMTPKKALEKIGQDIVDEGTKSSSYIKFASGDDGDYITQPFTMQNRLDRYGEQYFTIRWEWMPNNAVDQSVISIAQGAGTNWAKAALERKTEDVKGNLKATVYYRESKPDQIIGTPVLLPIMVYGTGKPATLWQYSQTIGASGEQIFVDTNLPSQKQMNIYDGNVSVLPQPTDPYEYKLRLNMGQYNAASVYAKAEYVSGDREVLEFGTSTDGAGVVFDPYKLDGEIANPKKEFPGVEGSALLRMKAKKVGTVTFKVVFYVQSKTGGTIPAAVQPRPITIKVIDTSPNDDATLKRLVLKKNSKQVSNETFDFKFDPAVKVYDLVMDYRTESVVLTPYRNDGNASQILKLRATRVDENGRPVVVVPTKDHMDGKPTDPPIILAENSTTKIEFTVTAENPNITETYTLNIRREAPSDDATLKSLNFFDESGKNYLTEFKPDQFNYTIEVPYSTKQLRVTAETNYATAFPPTFQPALDYKNVPLVGKKEWFKLIYDKDDPAKNRNVMKVSVMPENNQPVDQKTYTVIVTRLAPSTNTELEGLALADIKEAAITYTPTFAVGTPLYEAKVPYSTAKVRLKATKEKNPYSSIAAIDVITGRKICDMESGKFTPDIEIPAGTEEKPYYDIQVLVTAEDEFSNRAYVMRIFREPPSTDSTLKALDVVGTGEISIKGDQYNYNFHPDQTSYEVKLPYEIDKVVLTATTNYANVFSLTVNGKKATSGTAVPGIAIPYPGQTKVEVEVVAEDGKTKTTYTLFFTRAAPSNDARLKALSVTGASALKPNFIPNILNYTSTVDKGGKAVTITAVPNHAKATMTINGVKVTGTTYGPMDILYITEDATIVVTAQDGTTTMTYKITFTNENLIEKSNNADLKSLKVTEGSMVPAFKPSIDMYDVAVKEKAYSVNIFPVAADPYAKVEVFSGSKELGDQNKNYSSYIQDGENIFTVKVTSHDETKTKTYTVRVYRNEDGKLNYLTPLKAADIKFDAAGDVIVVDIRQYTRVAADVFNTLRDKYPAKSIVFEGNDYSLQFNGSEITRVIPQTTVFDFAMKFTSPDSSTIHQKIDSKAGNNDYRTGDVVMVYFTEHGGLPAPAIFNLSLGTRYAESSLYWHYFNKERDRIDYYGKVNSNSKGTFALKLDHLSTYIITRKHRIVGAENKDGGVLSGEAIVEEEEPDLAEEVFPNKNNPGTGNLGVEQ